MENCTLKKKSKCDNDISLYVGASALFISVVTLVFFYREIKKIKKEVIDIRQIKNQISNIDTRFDIIDNSMEEIVKRLQEQKQVHFKLPPVEKEIPLKEEQEEAVAESDSDEEIEIGN